MQEEFKRLMIKQDDQVKAIQNMIDTAIQAFNNNRSTTNMPRLEISFIKPQRTQRAQSKVFWFVSWSIAVGASGGFIALNPN
ncbi:MAG: hypothetical protein QNJ41_25050 [Xenococcaceae cyanobacterium MO_188.B32]|nr:hypothetical protein [Xenococcaceae cyanobacterium MO_188.B32]